jgi:hypothetical protein
MVLFAVPAMAQESEFKGKLQEDLDGYAKSVLNGCGATVKVTWGGGKLGFNPRESEKPEWNSVSTLCTSALEAVESACLNNGAVKEKLAKLTTVTCSKGKGTIGFTLKGATLTLTIDPSFAKNNAAGQRDDLVKKLKKDLDT